MERAVYHSKSFIIALALIRGRLSAEEASLAAHVEVQSQINRWGEVEDSEFMTALLTDFYTLRWELTTPERIAHDVDHRDIRRQLGSVAIMVANV
jgi:ATP synthase mitochondrial F1 complex assembly factor 2